MPHALIIDDNLIVGRWIEDQLIRLGFSSFDHAWTEADAIEAAACRPPDLVVIGDAMEEGSSLEAARAIAARHEHVAILVVTGDRARTERNLPAGASLDGPFRLHEFPGAVAMARQGRAHGAREAHGRPSRNRARRSSRPERSWLRLRQDQRPRAVFDPIEQ